jgi:hypothetical protein
MMEAALEAFALRQQVLHGHVRASVIVVRDHMFPKDCELIVVKSRCNFNIIFAGPREGNNSNFKSIF